MAEEPSLPRLPGVSWDERSQSFSNNPRKRGHSQRHKQSQSFLQNSSDPAVFSSDDDPGLDNYTEGRRKKRYVGSWFQQQPASSDSAFSEMNPPPKPKRKLARQLDSGVFLGSDETESDGIPESLDISIRPRLPQLDRRPVPQVSGVEKLAAEKIRACVDQGDDEVMLWSLGLDSLSNETIEPLTRFSCIPVVVKDVAFEQKDPQIKLILGANRLTRIPGAIFDVKFLTVLSLRGNKLTELPQGISKLENLKELNVSQNRLRHLPKELLDLVEKSPNLFNLGVYPNPFMQPSIELESRLFDKQPSDRPMACNYISSPTGERKRLHLISWRVGRSPVQISDSRGRVLSSFSLPSWQSSTPVPAEQCSQETGSWNELDTMPKPTAVPSLFEMALRTCYACDELPEMRDCIADEYVHLKKALDRAVQIREQGGLACSTCKRSMVAPVAEWIEWHELARSSSEALGETPGYFDPAKPLTNQKEEWAVPFLSRACSLRCSPSPQRSDEKSGI